MSFATRPCSPLSASAVRRCAPGRRPPAQRRRVAVAAAEDAAAVAPALLAAGAVAGALTTSLVARFAVSARLDFALAARLKAATPPEATAALLLPADARATRDLFLLPDRIADATAVGADVDAEWWAKAATQAGVRVATRRDSAAVATASVDVVVIRDSLSTALDPGAVLTDAARTLKPGGVLVALQRVAGDSPLRPLILRSSATKDCMPQAALEAALDASSGWSRVAVDIVGAPADAAAVVVAVRSGAGVPDRKDAASAARAAGVKASKADVLGKKVGAARTAGGKGFSK